MKLNTSIFYLFIFSLWAYPSQASQMAKRQPIDTETKKSLIAVLETNEALHRAFFDYDGKAVETLAQKLQKRISAIKNDKIAQLLKFSQKKLKEIKAAKNRDFNNQNYHLISMALIYLVNRYDLGTKYNAYSCPMIKKKWIQNSDKIAEVHNPYAPRMPHCGSQDTHY